jgi:hypothetical protein
VVDAPGSLAVDAPILFYAPTNVSPVRDVFLESPKNLEWNMIQTRLSTSSSTRRFLESGFKPRIWFWF